VAYVCPSVGIKLNLLKKSNPQMGDDDDYASAHGLIPYVLYRESSFKTKYIMWISPVYFYLTFVAYSCPSVDIKFYLFVKRKLVWKRRDGKPF
jgi:hypothetical protein